MIAAATSPRSDVVAAAIRVHDPEPMVAGDHFFALSAASAAAAADSIECTLKEAPQVHRAVLRALLARAQEWFEQPIRTETDMAAYFPVSLDVAILTKQHLDGGGDGGGAVVGADSTTTFARWRVRGLTFTDGAFLWSLEACAPPPPPPPPPPPQEPAKLKLRIAAGTAVPTKPARRYRNTPMVRRSSHHLPSDEDDDGVVGEEGGRSNKDDIVLTACKKKGGGRQDEDVLDLAESEAIADKNYHEYVAAMEHARHIRIQASRRFLARSGIRHADHLADGAETP